MRLYIVRHADPDYENDNITEDGRAEAQALSGRLAAEKIDHYYCSPLGRARATADYTAQATGKRYQLLEWAREIPNPMITLEPYGRMATWDIPGEMLFDGRPAAEGEGWWDTRLVEGARLRSVYGELVAHSDQFLSGFGYNRRGQRYEITKENREKVVVFCHNGFALTWLSHLLRLPTMLTWSGFWLPPTSVTTILFEERSSSWAVPRCIGLADTSHLYAAGIPVLPRGLHGNYY